MVFIGTLKRHLTFERAYFNCFTYGQLDLWRGTDLSLTTSVFNPQKLWLINSTAWTHISICNISYLKWGKKSQYKQKLKVWWPNSTGAVCGWGVCVCVCTADFLSRFAQTGRPHGPIKTRRVGRVSAFLGEIPHFNNHYYLSLFNVTTAVTKIASGLTSTTARLSRLTRGITVSQYLQKPLFDPVALSLLLEKAGVVLVHAGLLSVNKINFSSVEEDVTFCWSYTAYSSWQCLSVRGFHVLAFQF